MLKGILVQVRNAGMERSFGRELIIKEKISEIQWPEMKLTEVKLTPQIRYKLESKFSCSYCLHRDIVFSFQNAVLLQYVTVYVN